jgi:hypothetical protein
MDQAIIEREAVQERLQGRTRRTPGPHHVHMAEARLVAEFGRTDVGARLERRIVDDEQRRRGARGQARNVVGDALLQRALQARVDRARDARVAWMLDAQASCEQGRMQRWMQ